MNMEGLVISHDDQSEKEACHASFIYVRIFRAEEVFPFSHAMKISASGNLRFRSCLWKIFHIWIVYLIPRGHANRITCLKIPLELTYEPQNVPP